MDKKRLQELAGILQENRLPNIKAVDPWGVATPSSYEVAELIIESMIQFYYDEPGEFGNHREFLANTIGQDGKYFDLQWEEFSEVLRDLVKTRIVTELPQRLKKVRREDVAHKRQQKDEI